MRQAVFFLWLIGLAPSLVVQAQEQLQYNLIAGQSFKIEQLAIQTIDQTIDSSQFQMKNTVAGTFSMVVDQVLEDRYIILSSFESIRFKTESNDFGVINSIDTDKIDSLSSAESKIFKGLLNVPFTIIMLKNGKIEAVENTSAMVDNMMIEAGIEDENLKTRIRESMKTNFGDASLAASIEQMTFLFPNHTVSIGDAWNNQYHGELNADNSWQLESYNPNEFVITGIAKVVMTTREEDILSISMSGVQTTTAIVDAPSGLFKEITVNQEVDGFMTGMEMGYEEIPSKINAIITFKRI